MNHGTVHEAGQALLQASPSRQLPEEGFLAPDHKGFHLDLGSIVAVESLHLNRLFLEKVPGGNWLYLGTHKKHGTTFAAAIQSKVLR